MVIASLILPPQLVPLWRSSMEQAARLKIEIQEKFSLKLRSMLFNLTGTQASKSTGVI